MKTIAASRFQARSLQGRNLAATLAIALAVPALAGAANCAADHEVDRVFADVPVEHPLCDEIESLYRDGLTSGCRVEDGQLYFCPSDPATRAQAAAFSEPRDPFAQLDMDGRIRIGDHVVNAERFARGHYWIQFSRDIQFCSREGWTRDRTGPEARAKVRLLNGTVDVVEVETTVNDQPLDLAFNVRLHCR